MALALSVSVYLLIMSGNYLYVSEVDVLLTPKNVKTAMYVNEAKENAVAIFEAEKVSDDDELKVVVNDKNTLIKIIVSDESKRVATTMAQEKLGEFIDTVGKLYSLENDFDVKVVNRDTYKKDKNIVPVLLISLVVGLFLAFLLQIGLDLVGAISGIGKRKDEEREIEDMRSDELKKIFDLNKEKIRKLSSDVIDYEDDGEKKREDFDRNENEVEGDEKNVEKASEEMSFAPAKEIEKKAQENDVADESGVDREAEEVASDEDSAKNVATVKTASFPSNLPIAEEKPSSESNNVSDGKEARDENESEDEEPTEEEFKKRLNELLRGE